MTEVVIGTVVEFDEQAGLGVVTTGDGRMYPFHCAEIADGTRTIDVGAAVGFDILRKLGRYEAGRLCKQ